MVIQRILRHANVSTTATYYIKTAADDVRNAMAKLENHIAEAAETQSDTNGTLERHVERRAIDDSIDDALSDWDCKNWRRGGDSNPR